LKFSERILLNKTVDFSVIRTLLLFYGQSGYDSSVEEKSDISLIQILNLKIGGVITGIQRVEINYYNYLLTD